MDLRNLIRAAPLGSRQQLLLTHAVPYLSKVQAGQLAEILTEQPEELARFLQQVAGDDSLTEQAKVEFAIHELAKADRQAEESADREEEIADIEQQLDDF